LAPFVENLRTGGKHGQRSLERRPIEASNINDIRNINERNWSWIRWDSVQVKNLSGL
jgi:hypothetical protein